jgi:hypothetical protein
VTLTRLGETFEEADSAGSFIVPYQTVCGYWNYWFQFLPEHFSGEDQFGLHERLIAPGVPSAPTEDQWPRNSLGDYAGSQADGRFSSIYEFAPPPESDLAGLFDPLKANDGDPSDEVAQPILHGGPYGPSGTESAPNCQAGQYGYGLGEALSPGQAKDNPSFGIQNISEQLGTPPLGRTDLFLQQDGRRVFWDSP